jgi:hypothetical protein
VEVFDLCGGDTDVWFGLRHGVEAIGSSCEWQVDGC